MRRFAPLALLLALVAGSASAQFSGGGGGGPATGDVSTLPTTASGTTTPRSLAARAADRFNIRDFGAVCDGNSANATANTTAIQNAVNAATAATFGATVYVPSGRCVLNGSITAAVSGNNAFAITGEGQEISELDWTSSGNGLVVTLTGNGYWIRQAASGVTGPTVAVSGLSLIADGATRTVGSALSMTATSDFVTARPAPSTIIKDVAIRSGNNGANWLNGITLTDMPQVAIDTAVITWATNQAANAGIQYLATGTISPTIYSLSNSNITGGATYGLYVDGAVQGFYATNNSIYAFTPVYWTGNGNQDNVQIVNNYVNYSVVGINNPPAQSVISNNLFNSFNSASVPGVGVLLKAGSVIVKSNVFYVTTNNTAIVCQTDAATVSSNQFNAMSDNIIYGPANGILLSAVTKNQLVSNNTFSNTSGSASGGITDLGTNNRIVLNMFSTGFAFGPANGPLSIQAPNNDVASGNPRDPGAIDFQRSRTSATQVASGANTAILSGSNNTAVGVSSVIIGGQSNLTLGGQSVAMGNGNVVGGGQAVGMGFANNVAGNFSVGFGAFGTDRGDTAQLYSAGRFTLQGDAQKRDTLLRGILTSATAVQLTTDGAVPTANNSLRIPASYVFQTRVAVTLTDTTNRANFATWNIKQGVLSRGVSAVPAYQGDASAAVAPDQSAGTASTATLTISADTTNNLLVLSVAWASATSARVLANVTSLEVN